MLIKNIVQEDFVNYKKPSMFIAFPFCSFKCERECGIKCCQNSPLAQMPNIEVSIDTIVESYLNNDITKAIVFGGLEPFDSFDDVYALIKAFRERTNDDIIIFTGYDKTEAKQQIILLRQFPNIIIKYGRFIPGDKPHRDELLGIALASQNQYAERI